MTQSIFLDFNLPNAPTWFYLSAILAITLFFKFTRILSFRNWDLLTLFALVPGQLLLFQEHSRAAAAGDSPVAARLWWGYLWLLAGSAYFMVRCLLDLALVRRPVAEPNLNRSGLACLMVAISIGLGSVAVQRPIGAEFPVGRSSAVLEEVQKRTAEIVTQTAGEPIDGRGTYFWVKHGLAAACHLGVIAALLVLGQRHFQDLNAGLAAAALYLLLPYIAYDVEKVQYVWPAALVLWAVVLYRQPSASGALIGVASGTLFFPALLLPAWLSFYPKRNRLRFAASFGIAVLGCLALAIWILLQEGRLTSNVRETLGLTNWQPWRPGPTDESIWSNVHGAYRVPVFLVYALFVILTAFWPRPKNLAHLISLSTATLIGVQFWYGDRGGVYVLWYLPLLLAMVHRPNLSDRFAPPDSERESAIERVGKSIWRIVRGWTNRAWPSFGAKA